MNKEANKIVEQEDEWNHNQIMVSFIHFRTQNDLRCYRFVFKKNPLWTCKLSCKLASLGEFTKFIVILLSLQQK